MTPALRLPKRPDLALDRSRIVGILNITPDSFSDGGCYDAIDAAVAHAHRLAAEGADLIDIGGESTRPGAPRTPADEQLRRVLPVIDRLVRELNLPLSLDTTLAAVAEPALDLGVSILNDISAGRDDPAMLTLAACRRVPIVLMHMQGEPATMQRAPHYHDVVREVLEFLRERAAAAEAAGVEPSQIVIDPGIGFGKTVAHNVALLGSLERFVASGYPVMLGVSRKGFLAKLTGEDTPESRLTATLATTALAAAAGVQLLRVHDVKTNREAASVGRALKFSATSPRVPPL